jgi:hypothetical protein
MCTGIWIDRNAHVQWRLQAHFAKYEPTILELKRKYEAAMKEKMLAGLDRDKMAAKVCHWPMKLAHLNCPGRAWRKHGMACSCSSHNMGCQTFAMISDQCSAHHMLLCCRNCADPSGCQHVGMICVVRRIHTCQVG